jgi:hypothetical protein
LIEKGGRNLRHLSMHGVLSPGEYRSLQSFYAWWLILKMTFMLTQAVQQRFKADARSTEADATGTHSAEAPPP